MTWFSKEFYWQPATDDAYGESISLEIVDNCHIELSMDDCKASPTKWDCTCEPECGYGNFASTKLSLQELKDFHKAVGEAIEYYEAIKRN